MRVAVYPADEGGCGFYRLIEPARALQRAGADVDLILPSDPQERQLQARFIDDEDGIPHLVDVVAPDADVVVLQRPFTLEKVQAIASLQDQGVRVVVEIDDDFEAISRRNVAWYGSQPEHSPRHNRQHLADCCQIADLVTVTTPALARRYGAHGRVAVVPNRVPARYLATERQPHDGIWIGWSGSTDTHPDDLQVTDGHVARAMRDHDARVVVVGTGKLVQEHLRLLARPMVCGWVDLDVYPDAIAQFDVGIVPLEPSPFNEAKSWLKGLEMAACGVPFLASASGPYVALAGFGVGRYVRRARDWETELRRLLGSAELRAELAGAGRSVVAERFTIEGHADVWWEAWGRVVNTRASSSAA